MANRKEVVLSAYTGILQCEMEEYQKYVEELMGRPVFIHEILELHDEIKKRATEEASKYLAKS